MAWRSRLAMPIEPYLVSKITNMVTHLLATKLYSEFIKIPFSRCRIIDLLKGRWKILQDLNVGLNHAPQTIVACCVLHNMCQIANEPEPELWKEADESGSPPKVPDSEKSFYTLGKI